SSFAPPGAWITPSSVMNSATINSLIGPSARRARCVRRASVVQRRPPGVPGRRDRAFGHEPHVDTVVGSALDAVHGARKIERPLDGPDFVVRARRKLLRRISNRNPADGQHRVRRQHRVDVYDAANTNFRSSADPRAMKDRDAGGEERFIFDGAAVESRMRTDEDVGADARRMAGGTSNHDLFAHDGTASNANRTIVADNRGAERDDHTGRYRHVAAHDGGRRDHRARVDGRPAAANGELHASPPSWDGHDWCLTARSL